MKARHAAELTTLETAVEPTPVEGGGEGTASTSPAPPTVAAPQLNAGGKKMSRAQKRRAKAAAEEKAEEERIARELAENRAEGPQQGEVEMLQIRKKLMDDNLILVSIPSDGDCLYNSVVKSLSSCSHPQSDAYSSQSALRAAVADTLLSNSDDFLYFVAEDLDSFEQYCKKVRETHEWGGQIELRALSMLLQSQIYVYKAADNLLMGEDYPESSRIYLSYHQHAFTLGEHYNCVVAADE
eukprot:TRINITY_DN1060_c0_g1_i1.p1 TRINITY_DN1060_c0_g1~~TRINITY_DN1060_c0_g1_i1.p1  ORF type:complete len:240 (-),score=50.39 TRINITY_DN1060_c0_g1_i1:113-832(-)